MRLFSFILLVCFLNSCRNTSETEDEIQDYTIKPKKENVVIIKEKIKLDRSHVLANPVPEDYYSSFDMFSVEVDSLTYFDSTYNILLTVPLTNDLYAFARSTNNSPIVLGFDSEAGEIIEISNITKTDFFDFLSIQLDSIDSLQLDSMDGGIQLDSIEINNWNVIRYVEFWDGFYQSYYIFPEFNYLTFYYECEDAALGRSVPNVEDYVRKLIRTAIM